MKKLMFILTLLVIKNFAFSQKLSIYISNERDEIVIGASVILEGSYYSGISNENGEFVIEKLKPGNYELMVSAVGYENYSQQLILKNLDISLHIVLITSENLTGEVIVRALRAGRNTPVVSSEIVKKELSKNNFGQDMPLLLNLMPSVTSTSDAGTGIGYTRLSIRGTDLTRINVTTNGIPLNDAESHGVWWVDLPDLASSVENIQVQRGVGTSTNGTSAFGANINLQTNQVQKQAYGELSLGYGSFNSYKSSIKAGTGLINNHFTFDIRLSGIHSDGYIDRAESNMKSFFSSSSYSDKKSLIKINVFSGNEITYQAWNGVPKVRLENDLNGMMLYQEHYLYTKQETQHMINSGNRTYNFYTYKNQVDNYTQTHFQTFFTHQFNPFVNLNLAFNYTHGKGYYEEFKVEQNLADYGLDPVVFENDTAFYSDLVRRKWLNNDFYVLTWSFEYYKDALKATIGGSYQNYHGKHYGTIIWAEYAGNIGIDHVWYDNNGKKSDFNIYGKFEYLIFEKLNLYVDFQYRPIDYKITGMDDNLLDISQQHNFGFFNPKFGLYFNLKPTQNAYLTIGKANREPSRTDFKDAPQGKTPLPESLIDYELGYTISFNKAKFNLNVYYMDYKNQLVRTGQLNDVGDAIMVNIDRSYRTGLEINGSISFTQMINWQLNATFSKNKINDFTEYIDNWDTGGQIENHIGESNLSFSPEIICGSQLIIKPFKNFETALISKYVGNQYVDNSSATDRQLSGYLVNNIRFNYSAKSKLFKSIDFQLIVNNIFNVEYETDAWVYHYFYENSYYNMDGYFPQAGINVMGGIVLGF